MLYLHEEHEVIGTREDEFEARWREEGLPLLAQHDGVRLLYFLKHALGTGPSYRVVTITAVRDGVAMEALQRSAVEGKLRPFVEALDGLRHDATGKTLITLPWSPLQDVDLATVPTAPADHEPSVFMEDTVWPYEGLLEDYVATSGTHYAKEMEERAQQKDSILVIQGSFRTAFGSHKRREVILWQKVMHPQALVPLVTRDVPPEYRKPGTWMHDALKLRDQWRSRLLRAVGWSPWY